MGLHQFDLPEALKLRYTMGYEAVSQSVGQGYVSARLLACVGCKIRRRPDVGGEGMHEAKKALETCSQTEK